VIDHSRKVINDYRTCLLIIPYNLSNQTQNTKSPKYLQSTKRIASSHFILLAMIFRMFDAIKI
jgi:hypothetical protein